MNEPVLDIAADQSLAARTLRKATWRLVPFLCLLYVLNLLDRSNVGFARVGGMEQALGMSEQEFNIGYGIFYLGYLAFEVPSNLLLRRVGARRWMGRIMISWGMVTMITLWVTGPWSFYGARILLGIAEAGFFPGIVYYLTAWFPARERARIFAWFMTANALAGVFGNPLSGVIMQYLGGVGGLAGWQWLFVLEGLPSVAIGIVTLFYLTDRPEQATWLDDEERAWLAGVMHEDEKNRRERHGGDFLRAAVDPRVWLLIALYFTVAVGANAAGAYYPKLIKEQFTEASYATVGILSALPHLCSVVAMTLWSTHSDRTGERSKHVAAAAFVAAAGWILTAQATNPWLALAGLCVAQAGMMTMLPIFWAIPTSFLTGAAAAGGIALINSVANIGGFFGPSILGALGLNAMAGVLAGGGCLALLTRSHNNPLPLGEKGQG